jgi:hypothetical protein
VIWLVSLQPHFVRDPQNLPMELRGFLPFFGSLGTMDRLSCSGVTMAGWVIIVGFKAGVLIGTPGNRPEKYAALNDFRFPGFDQDGEKYTRSSSNKEKHGEQLRLFAGSTGIFCLEKRGTLMHRNEWRAEKWGLWGGNRGIIWQNCV